MLGPVDLAMKCIQALMSYHFKEPNLLRHVLNLEPGRYQHSARSQCLVSLLSRKWFRDTGYSICMFLCSSEHLFCTTCIHIRGRLTCRAVDEREWDLHRNVKYNVNLADIADQTVLSHLNAAWNTSKEDKAAFLEAIIGAVEIDGGSRAVESVMVALGFATPKHIYVERDQSVIDG